MTGSPSPHAGFDPPLPPQQQRPDRQPYHRRQASTSSSLQYEYGLPIADNDNDDDDDDDDDETMSVASGAAVATPGSHYSISSSTAEQIVIPPRIHASFFGSAQKEGANQNHLNGGRGGYDLKKRETRRALVRVLVEGREAPFDKVRLEEGDIDLPRLISQVRSQLSSEEEVV